ncbi:MAG: SufE family protein [Rhodomicrobium sp.]|nr:SufE family protein [Rhodomicrobium sp.]
MTSIDDILDNFALLDDWEDRYRYVIELGNTLEPLSEQEHSPKNKVRGCASQVWLVSRDERAPGNEPRLYFCGDSDAHIVRGLIAILLAIYSGKTAGEVARFDAEGIFARMGLKDHLTQQRSNGLASMIMRIRADAAAALKGAERPS